MGIFFYMSVFSWEADTRGVFTAAGGGILRPRTPVKGSF